MRSTESTWCFAEVFDGTWLGNYRLEAYLRNPVKIHLKGKSKKVRAICLVKECLPRTSQALSSNPSLRSRKHEWLGWSNVTKTSNNCRVFPHTVRLCSLQSEAPITESFGGLFVLGMVFYDAWYTRLNRYALETSTSWIYNFLLLV